MNNILQQYDNIILERLSEVIQQIKGLREDIQNLQTQVAGRENVLQQEIQQFYAQQQILEQQQLTLINSLTTANSSSMQTNGGYSQMMAALSQIQVRYYLSFQLILTIVSVHNSKSCKCSVL
jgi:adenine-specific DNA methylase